jgi:murein DD-endopeptidase MepM/ murein hydrolase activator NlpD
MSNNVPAFIFLFLFILTTTAEAQKLDFLTGQEEYLWPTNSSRQISSTFGETRSAHLHAGLDIRSFGREGFEVYATRDGVVHRIGMGPHGYGNVVYLKHTDGSFSVYAHLNRFEPELQAFADSIRMRTLQFDLDQEVTEHKIEYKKGDVIAYTGSTGIGPPHLHFELRTPDFKPFNPLLTNLEVRDTIAPIFQQLAVEFKDPESLHPTGFEIYNAYSAGDEYQFGEINVSGPIGLSVNVSDKVNSTPNSYAVYSLMMIADSDTLFHSVADYFPYEYSSHMFLDRSYPILAQTRRGFQRLFIVNGNNLPFYQEVKNKGILWMEEGVHNIRILAKDIYGNTSSARVTLHVEENKTDPKNNIQHVPTYPNSLQIDRVNTDKNTVTSQLLLGSTLLKSLETGFTPVKKKVGAKKHIQLNGTAIQFLDSDQFNVLSNPDETLWLKFPKGTLYDPLTLQMSTSLTDEGLKISFNPDRLPIHYPIQVQILLSEYFDNTDSLALYSIDEFRNRRYFLDSSISDGILRAELFEISSLIVTKDKTAPWIGMARIGKDLAGNQLVIFPVRDEESGIDYKQSTITVNGESGLTGYDPDKRQLYFYKPGFTLQKVNEASVSVFDRAGNFSSRSSSFRFTP